MTRYHFPDPPAPVRTRKDGSTFKPHLFRLYKGHVVVRAFALGAAAGGVLVRLLLSFTAGVFAALLLPVVL